MDILAIKLWADSSIIYRLQRCDGELKWVIVGGIPMLDLLGRTYIDLGVSPEPFQYIIDFEPSHLLLGLVSAYREPMEL